MRKYILPGTRHTGRTHLQVEIKNCWRNEILSLIGSLRGRAQRATEVYGLGTMFSDWFRFVGQAPRIPFRVICARVGVAIGTSRNRFGPMLVATVGRFGPRVALQLNTRRFFAPTEMEVCEKSRGKRVEAPVGCIWKARQPLDSMN
jgi:hypothetical protein